MLEPEPGHPAVPHRGGVLILVVGPSGAGKDTLIDHARAALAGTPIAFARRIVTRPSNDSEPHETLDRDAFARAAHSGAFAFQWQAHGLDYAIPIDIDSRLAAGEAVVCNVSRGVVADLRSRYPRVHVIYVYAPLATRLARIAGRQRSGETTDRGLREPRFAPEAADVVIDNEGAVEAACHAFAEAVRVAAELDPTATFPLSRGPRR